VGVIEKWEEGMEKKEGSSEKQEDGIEKMEVVMEIGGGEERGQDEEMGERDGRVRRR
jgi:hypothetical protein